MYKTTANVHTAICRYFALQYCACTPTKEVMSSNPIDVIGPNLWCLIGDALSAGDLFNLTQAFPQITKWISGTTWRYRLQNPVLFYMPSQWKRAVISQFYFNNVFFAASNMIERKLDDVSFISSLHLPESVDNLIFSSNANQDARLYAIDDNNLSVRYLQSLPTCPTRKDSLVSSEGDVVAITNGTLSVWKLTNAACVLQTKCNDNSVYGYNSWFVNTNLLLAQNYSEDKIQLIDLRVNFCRKTIPHIKTAHSCKCHVIRTPKETGIFDQIRRQSIHTDIEKFGSADEFRSGIRSSSRLAESPSSNHVINTTKSSIRLWDLRILDRPVNQTCNRANWKIEDSALLNGNELLFTNRVGTRGKVHLLDTSATRWDTTLSARIGVLSHAGYIPPKIVAAKYFVLLKGYQWSIRSFFPTWPLTEFQTGIIGNCLAATNKRLAIGKSSNLQVFSGDHSDMHNFVFSD